MYAVTKHLSYVWFVCNSGGFPPITKSRHWQTLKWLIRNCWVTLLHWHNHTFVHPTAVRQKRACKQYSRVPPCWRLCLDAQIECSPKRSKILRVGVQQALLHPVSVQSKDYSENMLGCKMLCFRHGQSTLQCLHIAVANLYVTKVNLCTCCNSLLSE